jgi:hypothetical protein
MSIKYATPALLSVVFLGFASCEKEDNQTEEKSTAQKIQAKWKEESWILERHLNGEDSSWLFNSENDEFFWDIRPDNRIYMMKGSEIHDTIEYALQNDTTILIRFNPTREDAYNIQILTDHTLKIYHRQLLPSNPDNYYAYTFKFIR